MGRLFSLLSSGSEGPGGSLAGSVSPSLFMVSISTCHFCGLYVFVSACVGNPDVAVKYRERLYYFSTDEAKAKFTANPELYTARDKPLEVSLMERALGQGSDLEGDRTRGEIAPFYFYLLLKLLLSSSPHRYGCSSWVQGGVARPRWAVSWRRSLEYFTWGSGSTSRR